jgi:hypothetical protein
MFEDLSALVMVSEVKIGLARSGNTPIIQAVLEGIGVGVGVGGLGLGIGGVGGMGGLGLGTWVRLQTIVCLLRIPALEIMATMVYEPGSPEKHTW